MSRETVLPWPLILKHQRGGELAVDAHRPDRLDHARDVVLLQKHRSGLDYPVGKEAIVRKAQDSGADDSVLDTLRNLPDRQYEKPTHVTEAVFGE